MKITLRMEQPSGGVFLVGVYLSEVLSITYILLDILVCSIAEYFYELCRILTSP